jgi:hypothetical protein
MSKFTVHSSPGAPQGPVEIRADSICVKKIEGAKIAGYVESHRIPVCLTDGELSAPITFPEGILILEAIEVDHPAQMPGATLRLEGTPLTWNSVSNWYGGSLAERGVFATKRVAFRASSATARSSAKLNLSMTLVLSVHP